MNGLEIYAIELRRGRVDKRTCQFVLCSAFQSTADLAPGVAHYED